MKQKVIEIEQGITLSFLDLRSEQLCHQHEPLDHILQIDYCREGRMGWHMQNGSSVYLGPRDYALHTMHTCADSTITLPNAHYQGLVLYINLNILSEHLPPLLHGTGITAEMLCSKFCQEDTFTSLPGSEETESIFSAFFCEEEKLRMAYWKIKSMELLLYLGRSDISAGNHLTEYQSEQIAVIRQIHEHLVAHMDQRVTIDSLSRQYLMNPTTLKNVFKAVYGNSIAAHIREHRMEHAAGLLLKTNDTIMQIARSVGYDTQSKFTAAFKEYFHMLPTEYRRQHT